jgi:hypothetical protein
VVVHADVEASSPGCLLVEPRRVSNERIPNQDPKLLRFVLSKPPDQVKYTNLTVRRPDFEEIQALAVEAGILKGRVRFDDYADPSFVPEDARIQPWAWENPP